MIVKKLKIVGLVRSFVFFLLSKLWRVDRCFTPDRKFGVESTTWLESRREFYFRPSLESPRYGKNFLFRRQPRTFLTRTRQKSVWILLIFLDALKKKNFFLYFFHFAYSSWTTRKSFFRTCFFFSINTIIIITNMN